MSRPRLRVVQVITRLILGGAQENTVLTCAGLERMGGYEVTLVTGPARGPEGDLFGDARSRGVRVEIIPELQRAVNPVRDLRAFIRLFLLFRRARPDIVHTHSAKAGVLGRIAARLAGVPLVFHTVHGLPFHEYQPRVFNILARLAEKIAGLFCDRMLAVGEVMRKKALTARLAREIEVVHSGMDVDSFLNAADQADVRRQLDLPPHAPVVGMLGRLAPLKGHEHLLEAAARLRERHGDLHLLLIGDGELRGRIEKRAAELGVPVRFTGLVPPDRIPDLLAATDVVAHTSFREGLPRAVPQALLAGRPVAAFDCDGAREVVVDGVTGRLVRPGDVEGLRAALEEILSLRDRGRSLAEEGRRRIENQFRSERMVETLDRAYRRSAAKQAAAGRGGS